MNPPLRRNCAAHVWKILSWSKLGSRQIGMLRSSRISLDSGIPISGTWHRRTFHPGSDVKPLMGEIGRIPSAVPS
eukprot:4612053-Pleurochrysis_carterae.AAC.1